MLLSWCPGAPVTNQGSLHSMTAHRAKGTLLASSAALQPPNEAVKLQKLSREQERHRARGCCQLASAEATAPRKELPALDWLPRTGTNRRSPTSYWLPPGRMGRADATRNTLELQTGAWLFLPGFSFQSYCTLCDNTQLPFLPGIGVTEVSCSHTNHREGWASSSVMPPPWQYSVRFPRPGLMEKEITHFSWNTGKQKMYLPRFALGLFICGNQSHLLQNRSLRAGGTWSKMEELHQQDVAQLVSVAVHTLPPTSQDIQGRFKRLRFSSDPKLPIPSHPWDSSRQHREEWGLRGGLLCVIGSPSPAMLPQCPQPQSSWRLSPSSIFSLLQVTSLETAEASSLPRSCNGWKALGKNLLE